MQIKIDIQRICVRAKPQSSNPDYFDWQTAIICIFVRENDKHIAVDQARRELKSRHWDFISYENKSTLIEERVRQAGGEVWEAYQSAVMGDLIFKVFPEHFQAGDKNAKHLLPAKITERFIDDVVSDVGGRRLTEAEKKSGVRNADYLIGDFIFELKDIQEEGLEKGEHQNKIAKLFLPYFPNATEIAINPSILSKPDLLKYLDIIGTPIKTHIRSASKQIKDTKSLLNRTDLRGGIILLNTGFGSFPHDAFANQVERYARKDSKQFFAIISISVWSHTNGFDSYVFYKFSPPEPEHKELLALRDAFSKRFEQMMTDVVKGNIPGNVQRASPTKPITFSHQGIDLAWIPPKVPLPWEKNQKDKE